MPEVTDELFNEMVQAPATVLPLSAVQAFTLWTFIHQLISNMTDEQRAFSSIMVYIDNALGVFLSLNSPSFVEYVQSVGHPEDSGESQTRGDA